MKTNARLRVACVCAQLVLGIASLGAAGQKVVVGAAVAPEQRQPIDQVDHREWTRLLQSYVDGQGRVDYAAWKKNSVDQRALDAYLKTLSRADRGQEVSRQAKLAYWINAYNAVTVKGILREYPTDSIRQHTAKLFGYNIWHDLLLVVGDEKISLHAIEHEVLRKSGDFRIHFAIVCASNSCPRLLNEAYTPARVERQLENNTRAFFRDKQNFDCQQETFHLSSIFKWFAEDFGSTPAERLRNIAKYLPDREAQRLASEGRGKMVYLPYDWGLNDQATARRAK